MNIEEIVGRLHDKGCVIARSQVNHQGRMVHLVQPWDVAMFQEDIEDIVMGRVSLNGVISRNKGADLADPWPVA
ncbi:MAG: hypothetical protein Q7R30_20260 [Acidobacteriota bacterium]|nr:hypothetical protein [Acidobacteriota bacterium]